MNHVSRALALFLFAVLCGLLQAQQKEQQQPQTPNSPPNQVQQIRGGPPPQVADPTPYTSKDGKIKGWKVVIPGNRALATPAVVDGKVFVGGGFGSHEFYAFDAATGKKAWVYQTADDGPTAAVVEDEYIAFNTESCELEILALDGKPVWKKWLGDPLMSMPAIADGKVCMAYPNSKGDKEHYLATFDLKTGKEVWKKKIPGEIITAPVIDHQQVYAATLEGTLSCFKLGNGELVWTEKKNATSSPMVLNGQCYFGRRLEVTVKKDGKEVKEQNEVVAGRGLGPTSPVNTFEATKQKAEYLDYAKRNAASPVEKKMQEADAGVGFGGAKGDAKIRQAMDNLGQASVSGVWSYQGSRPFAYKDQLFSAMGDTLQCIDPKTEKVLWKQQIRKEKSDQVVDGTVTPPAVVNDKMFVGTTFGEVQCRSVKTGELLWSANIAEPVVFQPAVAKGRVYVSTSTGHLYCLETGDEKDDGWLMWGANAAHSGAAK
jgi:outer membrane protein assembly factor BamB